MLNVWRLCRSSIIIATYIVINKVVNSNIVIVRPKLKSLKPKIFSELGRLRTIYTLHNVKA